MAKPRHPQPGEHAMYFQLDHVAIHASDVARSTAFYCRVFGLENEYPGRWENSPTILIATKSRTGVAIFRATRDRAVDTPEHGDRTAGVIDHFAFRLSREDWEAFRDRLSTLGIPFEEKEFGICTSVFIRDPDGILIEITTYPEL